MEKLFLIGRYFYGAGLAGIGILQFIYGSFRPMLLPYWPESLPAQNIFAYLIGAVLIVSGIMIALSKKAGKLCLSLGILFLLFFCFHVLYQLFLGKDPFEPASWTNPLKALAFAGGAFIMTGTFQGESHRHQKSFILAGRIFFSIMLIVFGIDHFLYAKFVAMLVPRWIPFPVFWTYFSAVALIGSGLCLLFRIRVGAAGLLCGAMLFLWLLVLHIPRAIAYPNLNEGNEITSAFQALAFSGIALVLSWFYRDRNHRVLSNK
jgi:uncharacterized membrane protein